MTKPDVVYICKGEGMDCYLHPYCIYRNDPIGPFDDICDHTLKPEFAKYGACDNPSAYPERFIFQEREESCGPSYYWEVEPK
jgi:hypothetical protein